MLSIVEKTSPNRISDANAVSDKRDVFLFDLSVLVPGKFGPLDHDFADYLRNFAYDRPCYLLTSVSYNELMSRLPARVRRVFRGIFVSSGAEWWSGDEMLDRQDHSFSDDLYEYLVKIVQNSAYPGKVAPLIENGPATLRVCLAGTRATTEQLKTHLKWEDEHHELPIILNELNTKFPEYETNQESGSSLIISPKSFSSALVHDQIMACHEGARLISYLSHRSAAGFAKHLCAAMSGNDLLTEVDGPSDLGQLMRYEIRRACTREL